MLKKLIKNTEERFISYKKLLEDYFKFKFNDEEYKTILREGLNMEKFRLKCLREEQECLNQGMDYFEHLKKII
jgi:hypothetical protein